MKSDEFVDDIILVGEMSWTEFRAKIIAELEECKTEKQFIEKIELIVLSCGTSIEELIERRKRFGLAYDDLEKQLKREKQK